MFESQNVYLYILAYIMDKCWRIYVYMSQKLDTV